MYADSLATELVGLEPWIRFTFSYLEFLVRLSSFPIFSLFFI